MGVRIGTHQQNICRFILFVRFYRFILLWLLSNNSHTIRFCAKRCCSCMSTEHCWVLCGVSALFNKRWGPDNVVYISTSQKLALLIPLFTIDDLEKSLPISIRTFVYRSFLLLNRFSKYLIQKHFTEDLISKFHHTPRSASVLIRPTKTESRSLPPTNRVK